MHIDVGEAASVRHGTTVHGETLQCSTCVDERGQCMHHVAVDGPADAPGERVAVNESSAPQVAVRRVELFADRWRFVRFGGLAVYGIAYALWFRSHGIIIDRISVIISVTLLLVVAHLGRPWYRWRRVALDLTLYSLMWLAYEETRGAADRLGMPIQVESVRNIDRAMFFGADPPVWLQQRFYSADVVRWYDVVASVVYYTHFVVPVAVIVVLWIADRRGWIRLMCRFATILAIACISFIVLPTAPPWMAAGGDRRLRFDALEPLARPAGRGWRHLGLDAFFHAWETGRDWVNRVAAMPSLHAGFSLMVVLVFWPQLRRRGWRLLALGYPLVMGVALVYLAEHYVIDVLAGWALVLGTFWAWGRIEAGRRGRRANEARRHLGIETSDGPATVVDGPALLAGRRRVFVSDEIVRAAVDAEHALHDASLETLTELIDEFDAGRTWLVTDSVSASLSPDADEAADRAEAVAAVWRMVDRVPVARRHRAETPGERAQRVMGNEVVREIAGFGDPRPYPTVGGDEPAGRPTGDPVGHDMTEEMV